ncbi:MAG: tRNA preQ1(34) S-adenosylmethionine ribosyltransferase-isomerase QueA [Candidatus Aminicenantales bacterium]
MLISEFDFDLPPGLIAQNPLPDRDASRMMVVRRKEEKILHARFGEFPAYCREGDVLILNDTKVIPAKVWGKRGDASVEFLFIKEKEPGLWDVLCKPAKKVRAGDRINFPDRLAAEVVEADGEGRRVLKFAVLDVLDHLKKIGFAPLPSYIKRRKEDAGARATDLSRYQTVFAAKEGAIAAPTAGLHFTPRVLDDIRRKGARIAEVTLDVGPATFQPIRVERLEDHRMLEETYEIPNRAAREINEAKEEKRPVAAVGTTVVRTLESAAEASYRVRPGRGATSLFIRPGHAFKIVDRLLTNFHLPKSTLLMLVAAFAGRDLILAAYREAVRERYRFFSYGDCMLIL